MRLVEEVDTKSYGIRITPRDEALNILEHLSVQVYGESRNTFFERQTRLPVLPHETCHIEGRASCVEGNIDLEGARDT